MSESNSGQSQSFKLATMSLAVALLAVLGAVLAPVLQFFGHERDVDAKMVEIGISILRAQPSEDISAIRA